MSMKESLQKIQKNLESAQAEITRLYDLLDNVEKTFGGVKTKTAPAKAKAPKVEKGSATQRVLGLVGKHAEGISTDALIKQTGLEQKTVYGILNKAKKQKKVKSPKRGVYIAV
jgi:hypothetical protein